MSTKTAPLTPRFPTGKFFYVGIFAILGMVIVTGISVEDNPDNLGPLKYPHWLGMQIFRYVHTCTRTCFYIYLHARPNLHCHMHVTLQHRSQTGIVCVCALAWLAHVIESMVLVRMAVNRGATHVQVLYVPPLPPSLCIHTFINLLDNTYLHATIYVDPLMNMHSQRSQTTQHQNKQRVVHSGHLDGLSGDSRVQGGCQGSRALPHAI